MEQNNLIQASEAGLFTPIVSVLWYHIAPTYRFFGPCLASLPTNYIIDQ